MASPTFQLVMRSGPTPGKASELDQPVISIGRDYSNDIVINDVEVSRKHARLTVQNGGYILEDMGSTNGTFVNGQRLLGPHLLRPGEIIAFGEKISLTYEMLQFDPNATVVSPVELPPYQPPGTPYTPPAQPAEGYVPASQPAPYSSQPAQQMPVQAPPGYYSGQIPASPAEPEEVEERRGGSRAWILLGVGCLVVFLCVCVGSAYVFDSLNLYCLPPFRTLFNFLYTCP